MHLKSIQSLELRRLKTNIGKNEKIVFLFMYKTLHKRQVNNCTTEKINTLLLYHYLNKRHFQPSIL